MSAGSGHALAPLRLGTGDGSVVEVHGDPVVMAELALLWGALAAPSPGRAQTDITATDLPTACAEINRTLVEHLPHPAVHSGVVALPSGAVAFPVVSGAGKSTLTAALCLAGAAYLSDEALVLDGTDGTEPLVLPYPKPLALSAWSAAAVGLGSDDALTGDLTPDGDRELLFPPSALGTTAGPTPLAHLLLLERTDGPPRLEPVHRREGLATLLRLSFNHYRDPRRFLVVAAAAVQGAQVHRLLLGDPREAAALVLTELS